MIGMGMAPDNDEEVVSVTVDPEGVEIEVADLDDGVDSDAAPGFDPGNLSDQQKAEAEEYAKEFLKKVARLRGVRIDRDKFLRAELHRRGVPDADIERAVALGPAVSGIPLGQLDGIAVASINFETEKSSALSFAAGLPGGVAILGTVPADITQFYVHAFRVMQKLAYLYGWQSFLNDVDDIDDETLAKLATFLGVMLGVGGAANSMGKFAAQVARPALQKNIANVALTKTVWYMPMKQTLRLVGVHVTKQSFAKTVTMAVPVVGGIAAGGLTFVVLGNQSRRLMKHLRVLPPPGIDAAEYLAEVSRVDQEPNRRNVVLAAVDGAGSTVRGAAAGAADAFRSVDLDGDGVPDEARALSAVKGAGSAVKGAGSTVKGAATAAVGQFGSMLHRRRRGGVAHTETGTPEEEGNESEGGEASHQA